MSIISSYMTSAGLVMCADCQETVGGYAKKSVDKILTNSNAYFHVAIGAATTSGHYADMLTNQLLWNLPKDSYDPEAIIGFIADTLRDFYTKHIWTRPAADQPSVELLIALIPIHPPGGFAGHPLLLHTAETAVNMVHERYKSIGIGSYLADFILEKYLGYLSAREHLVALGVYLMKEVRENIDGCGKEATLHFFDKSGEWWQLDSGDELYEDLESLVEHLNDNIRESFVFMTSPRNDREGIEDPETNHVRKSCEEAFARAEERWRVYRESVNRLKGNGLA
jgi:GNAT superfamily N-acetyltransferase